MDTREMFARRILELREAKGLSRQKVADDLGITRASLEYYEKGLRTPNLNIIREISDYYQVSIDFLFGKIDTATHDMNIKFVSDFTGLNEKSLNILRKPSIGEKIDIVNSFVESRQFLIILELIDESGIYLSGSIDDFSKAIDDPESMFSITKEAVFQKYELYQLKQFQAQKTLSDFIEQYNKNDLETLISLKEQYESLKGGEK